MKEYAIVKDLSYSDVVYMLQEKNLDAKEISERSVGLFCTSNNIRKHQKKELQKKNIFVGIKGMTFKVFVIHRDNSFLERFWKRSPKLCRF